ncbi:MAG: acetate--CoA ligase family protein [Candidatus Hodarchaeales archaeon]
MVDLHESLDRLFTPRTVAMIGASNNLSKWGFIILHNILRASFNGKIYPVNPNPKYKEILGLETFRSVLDIPEEIDMAIIVVPAKFIPKVLEECIEKGITAASIITAGFSETGKEGTIKEREIVDLVKGKMRFVGPNGMGIASGSVRLNAIMFPAEISPGNFSFVSQSGNLGVVGLIVANSRGVGINKFASSGNAADLSLSDYLEYLGGDPTTKVIGLYMEGLKPGEGRRFSELAKKISPHKPILILKSGTSKSGAKAAASHTAALAGKDEVFDAMFNATGIIRVNNLDEMFDFVICYNRLPAFTGNNAGILTAGGGWGVLTSDSCSRNGINLPNLPDDVISKIDDILPSFWARSNPVDTVGILNVKASEQILEILLSSTAFDAVMTLGGGLFAYFVNQGINSRLITNPMAKEQFKMVKELELQSMLKMISLMQKYNKPVFFTTILGPDLTESVHLLVKDLGFPVFYDPDRMTLCYKRLQRYYCMRKEKLGTLTPRNSIDIIRQNPAD